MNLFRTLPPDPSPPARVAWSDGVVVLRDEALFGPDGGRLCERFLGRVLGVEGVRSVSIDRSKATATIRHDAGQGDSGEFLRRLSAGAPGPGVPRVGPGAAAEGPGSELHHPSPRRRADDLRGRQRPARPAPPPPRDPHQRQSPGPTGRAGPGDGAGGRRDGPQPDGQESPHPLRPRGHQHVAAPPARRRGVPRLGRMGPRAARADPDPVRPGEHDVGHRGAGRFRRAGPDAGQRGPAGLDQPPDAQGRRAPGSGGRGRACRCSTPSSSGRRWRAASSSPRR